MAFELRELSDLASVPVDTVIDVRSPAEYAEDHVPGAISLPVLSDEERARVGTIYVQDSPFKARKLGAALVARNAARHIETVLADKDGAWRPLVYCWRGGQRSGSFATILQQIGWRTQTLAGGYQSYRRLVVEALYQRPFPAPVILLDGNTGTGKTRLLGLLGDQGLQTIDLEGLANHRGSSLGAFGRQPSQKAFESALAEKIVGLDPKAPVVIEAESSRVGKLNVPPALWRAMQEAPRIEITAPEEDRVGYLVSAYADLIADPDALCARLQSLVPLRGRARVDAWIAMVRDGAHRKLVMDLIQHHYDPGYKKARRRNEAVVVPVTARSLDASGLDALAGQVVDAARSLRPE